MHLLPGLYYTQYLMFYVGNCMDSYPLLCLYRLLYSSIWYDRSHSYPVWCLVYVGFSLSFTLFHHVDTWALRLTPSDHLTTKGQHKPNPSCLVFTSCLVLPRTRQRSVRFRGFYCSFHLYTDLNRLIFPINNDKPAAPCLFSIPNPACHSTS